MNRVSTEGPRPDAVRDLADAIAVRQDGGSASPEVLARSFLEHLQGEINTQVDARVREQLSPYQRSRGGDDKEMVLGMALGSMGIGVPLTAAAGFFAGFPGIALVWVGIILINLAWSQRR